MTGDYQSIIVPLLLLQLLLASRLATCLHFEPICGQTTEGRLIRSVVPINYTTTAAASWQCRENKALRLIAEDDEDVVQVDGEPTAADRGQQYQCPADGIHQFPVRGSCVDFHYCLGGVHKVRQCANGMHFDAKRGGCNFRELANCRRDWCPAYNEPGVVVTVPSKVDCGQFFICYDNEPQQFQCIGQLHWNQLIQDCDLPANSGCTIEPTPPPPPATEPPPPQCPSLPGVHHLPHPSDCQRFYTCIGDGVAHPRHCPDELLFDPEIGHCNRPENFECAR